MRNPLFTDNLKRSDLLGWTSGVDLRPILIHVFRNHSFEMTASVLTPFAGFAGFAPYCTYSDYDDSLNFVIDEEADLNLIWLDLSRYKNIDLAGWLLERAAALRNLSQAPIVACGLSEMPLTLTVGAVPDFFYMDAGEYIGDLGEAAFDEEKAAYSGTRLSNKACLRLARALGLKYIPAVLKPALKAVVVDLDNTLYAGVLGEDGLEALALTPGHERLQRVLKKLKEQGFFLGLASKNEAADVADLFARRCDFPLTLDDFTVVIADWNNKADNIAQMAAALNIGPESMLFLDDNPAEIQNVSMAGLGVHTVWAESPEASLQALRYYPGLMKLSRSVEDDLRADDLRVNQIRKEMSAALSREEYFKKLAIRLVYSLNQTAQLPRISELLGKTNQFILSYQRYRQTTLQEIMSGPGSAVATVAMSDSLSDSGLIAIVVGRRGAARQLIIDELAVSCRALGRNIEDIMLFQAFELLSSHLAADGKILVPYTRGPRNAPALEWLNRVSAGGAAAKSGLAVCRRPADLDTTGLTIEIEAPGL